jgi:hypothetical protein
VPMSIAFAFVATHNHFVLDRGGKVFNRSAPVIKLPPDATEDDHLALVRLLNVKCRVSALVMKSPMTLETAALRNSLGELVRGCHCLVCCS